MEKGRPMAESKYGKYICTELKKNIPLPPYRDWERDMIGDGLWEGYHRSLEHVVWTDSEVMPGSFYSEMVWQWSEKKYPNVHPRIVLTPEQMKKAGIKPGAPGVPPHAHPFPELLSFFGTDVSHPEDLHGEVEFWMEDEKYVFTKSFVVYIPANVRHCPLRVLRMDDSFFHYTIGPGNMYV
jgi:hypothetical protein